MIFQYSIENLRRKFPHSTVILKPEGYDGYGKPIVYAYLRTPDSTFSRGEEVPLVQDRYTKELYIPGTST